MPKSKSGIKRGGVKAGSKSQASKRKAEREKLMKSLRPITEEAMKSAWDKLHREREFPRICDLRRELNWPRESFDAMLRGLRDSGAVHMAQVENRYYTKDELADCWVDENGYRMGTIDWNN